MIKIFSMLVFAPLLSLSVADCDMSNNLGAGEVRYETDPALCAPMGPGLYTFGMTVTLTSLGIPGGSDGPSNPSVQGGFGFQIMDNTCKVVGVYTKPACGIPYVIHENFLQYVLTVRNVFGDVGDPYFQFDYANGRYSIGNNHCTCSDIHSSFPSATKGCKCAFPVNGESTKRGITFEA